MNEAICISHSANAIEKGNIQLFFRQLGVGNREDWTLGMATGLESKLTLSLLNSVLEMNIVLHLVRAEGLVKYSHTQNDFSLFNGISTFMDYLML